MSNHSNISFDGTDDWEEEFEDLEEQYLDPERLEGATILTRRVALPLDGMKTHLNNNLMVIAPPGAGKSRNVIGPNIMNCAGSYVVIDPKGALYDEFRAGLEDSGYDVQLIDFKRPARSTVHWSPFDAIRDDQDCYTVCKAIVCAHGGNFGDPFWDLSALQLLESIVMLSQAESLAESRRRSRWRRMSSPESESHPGAARLGTVLEHMRQLYRPSKRGLRGDSEIEAPCELDDVMNNSGAEADKAYELWQMVRLSADRTFRSVKVTLGANVQPLNHEGLVELMDGAGPRLDPAALGDRPTALFISISDTERSMDFLAKLCVEQVVQALVAHADDDCGGRLSQPVRLILDDFATMGRFKDVPSWVNSVRSRGIGITMVCQSLAQLEGVYGDEAEGLVAACDTCLFVGAQNDPETRHYIGRRLGVTRQARTWNGAAWAFVRGRPPHLGMLYEPERHPNYPRFEVARWACEEPGLFVAGGEGRARADCDDPRGWRQRGTWPQDRGGQE